MAGELLENKIISSFLGRLSIDNTGSRVGQEPEKIPRMKSSRELIGDQGFSLLVNWREPFESKDLSQLMQDGNRANALFFGEMYNRKELLDLLVDVPLSGEMTQSELCCLLYERYGEDFARKINGIFSIVLWDRVDRTLLLIADRFGLARPIFFSRTTELIFSNRLRVLIRNMRQCVNIDTVGLSLFLKYSYIAAPRTIFEGIEKLNHGEMVICKRGYTRKKRYSASTRDAGLYTIRKSWTC